MNQFEGECRYALANQTIMKENIYGNMLGEFIRDIGSMENNNNCKFKLKQNRKLLNQNSTKRLRCLKKNKISEIISLNDTRILLPPKAPENRTQYLTNLKKQLGLFIFDKNQTKNKQKLAKILSLNNNDDRIKNNFYSRKNSFENALSSSTFGNKENLSFEDFTRKNSDWNDNDCGNIFEDEKQKSDFYNFHPEDDFLTGSTMKSIVESITKSKNKILSNSLNLDGNQSNLYFTNKENIPICKKISLEIEKEKEKLTAENLVEMNFKISDFIPDLQMDSDISQSNSSQNLTEQLDFFQWQNLNKLDSDLADRSTKEASADNSPFTPRSPISLTNLRENEIFQFQDSFETIEHKENFRFFLLGNKKQRSFTDEYSFENKENTSKKFFYDDKKS